MAGRVVLHIGAHKTASTHLQHSILAQAKQMENEGILFMGPAVLRGDWFPLARIVKRQGIAASFLRQPLAAQMQELREKYRRILISEENILGNAYPETNREQLYPDAMPRLKSVIRGLELQAPEVLLAVRDPATHLISSYSQRLFSGDFLPFEEFAAGIDAISLRWSDLVLRLLKLKRISCCTIWRYEDYPLVMPQVLERALPDGWADRVTPVTGARHMGLSQRAYDQVLEWYHSGEAPSERPAALAARSLFPKSEDEPAFAPLGEDVLATSRRAYDADIAALAGNPRVRLLQPAAEHAE